jgi:Entner-Doudoroff aldolase
MGDVIDALRSERLIAILRYHSGGDVDAAVAALAAGGIRIVEVTADTPGAWPAIATAAGAGGLLVGAGTVTEPDEVRRAADCGARFVVSPGLVPGVVELALELGLTPLPGVATPTEVLTARALGCGIVKLFPAGSFGAPYLRNLRGPFATTGFVPTGGVGVGDVPTWLQAGAVAVGLGSGLVGRAAPDSAYEAEQLAARAKHAVQVVRDAA